jgi:hypothetical protein
MKLLKLMVSISGAANCFQALLLLLLLLQAISIVVKSRRSWRGKTEAWRRRVAWQR